MRLLQVTCLFAVLAAVVAGSASALAFADEDYFWPTGGVGEPYSKQLIGRTDVGVPGASGTCDKGAKCNFTLIAGAFPPGISMTSGGLVSGTPTQLGTFAFWLQLSGNPIPGTPAEREFSITINRVKLTVSTATLMPATTGTAYSQTLAATGGSNTGYVWSLDSGTLPVGLALNPDGSITGTPTATGASTFTVKVTDINAKTDTKQLSIKVVAPLTATVTPPAKVGEVGRPLAATVAGTGGTPPYTWTLTGDPPGGVTFDPAQAVLSGTPTTSGRFQLSISLKDADGLTKSVDVPLRVVPKLTIATKRLAAIKVGRAYVARLALQGGARPFTWRLISAKLPKGLKFNATRGSFFGTVTTAPASRKAGAFTATVRVRDGLGAVSTQTFLLSVRA